MKKIIINSLIFTLLTATTAYSEGKQVPDCFAPLNSTTVPGRYIIGYKSDKFGNKLVVSLQNSGLQVLSYLKFIGQIYVESQLSKTAKENTLKYFNELVLNPEILFITCGGRQIGAAN